MTNEQINAAIAEFVGIQFIQEPCGLWSAMWPNGKLIGFKIGLSLDHVKRVATPNFCGDLNEMHEVEKLIIREAKENDYWFYVGLEVGMPQFERCKIHYFDAVRATAHQRAKAFLKTFGKWKEAK